MVLFINMYNKSNMTIFYRTIMLLIVCSLTLGAFRGDFSLAGYRMFAGKHPYLKQRFLYYWLLAVFRPVC